MVTQKKCDIFSYFFFDLKKKKEMKKKGFLVCGEYNIILEKIQYLNFFPLSLFLMICLLHPLPFF